MHRIKTDRTYLSMKGKIMRLEDRLKASQRLNSKLYKEIKSLKKARAKKVQFHQNNTKSSLETSNKPSKSLKKLDDLKSLEQM
jgi:hypothetical protein